MSIEGRVRVFLHPHANAPAVAQRPAWQYPAGVPVHLTQRGGAGPADFGVTDDGGTTPVGDLERAVYDVTIPDPRYAGFVAMPLDLTNAEAGQRHDVMLVPQNDLRLVVVQLTYRDGSPADGASVRVTQPSSGFDQAFRSDGDGLVYVLAPEGEVELDIAPSGYGGHAFRPAEGVVPYNVPPAGCTEPLAVVYWPVIRIVVTPTVTLAGGPQPLTGASVTVEYRGSAWALGSSQTSVLELGQDTVPFEFCFPGIYVITVLPP